MQKTYSEGRKSVSAQRVQVAELVRVSPSGTSNTGTDAVGSDTGTDEPGVRETARSDESPPSLARNSSIVAAGTMVSRISGLGRVLVIAAVLGPTFFGNLFQTTNVLPNLLFELFVGALVASLLVPPLIERIDRRDPDAVARFAGGFLGVVLVGFGIVATITVVAAPLLLRLLAIGIQDPAVHRSYLRVGLPLVALLVPQVFMYAIAATGNAVQNAHGRFALSSAAPALENVGVIATLLIFMVRYGDGLVITEVGFDQVLFLGIGTTLSSTLHAGAQWWGAHRVGVTLIPRAGWRDPEIRRLGRLALPSVGWAALNFLRLFAPLIVLGGIAGAVVAFQLALNFVQATVALGSRPMAMALLPVLSRLVHDGDKEGFQREHRAGVDLSLFVIVPAAAFLGMLAWSVAPVVAIGNMASSRGVQLCAVALMALAPAIVGDGIFTIATNASYARRDARSPLIAMALRIAVMGIGITIAFQLLEDIRLLGAVAGVISLADLVGAGLLQRRFEGVRSVGVSRVRTATAAVIGASVALLATSIAAPMVPPLVVVAAASAAGGCVYLMIQGLSGAPQLSRFS